MTPPRPSPWGAASWLWWPVVLAGWSLAAVVMGAEWVASGARRGREGQTGSGSYPRPPRRISAVLGPLAAVLALTALAACAPNPGCPWPGFKCAIGGPPMTALAADPPVTVPNPFLCPGARQP